MRWKIYLWTLAVVLVIVAAGMRLHAEGAIIPGDEAYYDFLRAEDISDGDINGLTEYSSQDIPFILNLYDVLLSPVADDFSLHTFMFLGPMLALLGALLTYYIYRKTGLDERLSLLSTLVFILSPMFIFMVFEPTRHVFAYVYVLLCIVSFLRFRFLSIPLFVLLPFVGIFHTLAAALALFVLERNSRSNMVLFFILGSVSILYYLPLYLGHGMIDISSVYSDTLLHLFSDMGGDMGLGIFSILLGIIGLSLSWKHKKTLSLHYTALSIILLLSLFRPYMAIYLNMAVSILVSVAIIGLWERRWRHLQIKNITLILVFCGLLFSVVAYMDLNSKKEPDQAIKESLNYLGYQEPGIVLSHHSYSNWITYFSGNRAFASPYAETNRSIWYTRNIETARAFLDKNDISYIYIHPDMKDGLIWDEDDEGLQFLLSNNETFDKLSEDIWMVKDES